MNKKDLAQFVKDYLHTAAWVTCESGENTAFTMDAKKTAKKDCELFINLVYEQLGEYIGKALMQIPGKDICFVAACDFFLTRNGHGAGFWDSPDKYGERHAEILTEISDKMGSVDCYHIRGPKSKLTF